MKGPPTTHGPRMPTEYWIQLGSPVFSCHKDKTKAVLKLFKHIKYTKGPYCADIRTVTLLKHGNVLIACCVLQVTVKGFTKWDNAYVGNLPVGPSLQMACDDNLLVFCSEINNRADCIDGYGLVVCLGMERHRGHSLSKQQMVCCASLGVCKNRLNIQIQVCLWTLPLDLEK